MKPDFSKAKQNMIDCQIRPFSVINEDVINVFSEIPREAFVAENQQPYAYTDDDLDIGKGRFLMEPAIHARLIQELQVQTGDQILDLVCGCGYSSIVLAKLGACVTAVDTQYWIDQAKENSQKSDKKPMRWAVVDNPGRGCAEYGPYDAIVINGAVEAPPVQLLDQLREGGKIATIYRDDKGKSQAMLFIKQEDGFVCSPLFDAFAPVLLEFQKKNKFVF